MKSCSKTKLGSELDRVKQLLIDNGYPDDVLISCIKQKLANFTAEKPCGPGKCRVYLKLPWVGHVSADRIKQHVPTGIRTKNTIIRKQPPRMCKNSNFKIKSDSIIGQHLI